VPSLGECLISIRLGFSWDGSQQSVKEFGEWFGEALQAHNKWIGEALQAHNKWFG
jgi:hypothetical protein